ncbi:MAG TPA: DsbA family protein, partial [Pedococcus sp.]
RAPSHPGCAGAAAEGHQRPLLLYLFDAYCPWSYGYLPALTGLVDRVGDEADVEVVSIGLHRGTPLAQSAPPLLAVQRATGVGFGPRFRRVLSTGAVALDSAAAAATVVALLAAAPGRPADVLRAAHRHHFWSGGTLSEPGDASRVAARLGLDAEAVEVFARSSRAADLASDDLELARSLGARRGPTLLVSHRERLSELEGPGASGETLVDQFRRALGRA